MRSSAGLPIRVRAGTNPGGPGHEWVRARWGPWLASDYLAKNPDGGDLYAGAASLRALGYQHRTAPDGAPRAPVDSGVVLWYTLDEDGREEWVPEGTPNALSRTCLLTTAADNQALSASDPQYQYRIRAVGAHLGAQLSKNNWDVKHAAGEYFERSMFEIVAAVPAGLVGVIRRWDFAWTKRTRSDYTAGVKFGWTRDGHYYLLNVVRMRGKPDEVFKTMRQTAHADGIAVRVVIPMDGTASQVVFDSVVRELAGYAVEGVKEVGKKEVRIATLQPQGRAGRLHLLQGAWNEVFLDEVSAYNGDGLLHDDQLDATAGAFLYATNGGRPTQDQIKADTEAASAMAKALHRTLGRAEAGWGEVGGADEGDGGGWGGMEPGWD